MPRPYDQTKLTKAIDRSIPGISYGFNDVQTFLDTGCYALNYLISNRFDGGIPLEGKFVMFAGDSGSGKSYIVSGNLIKDCQQRGIWPILLDTENAMETKWLQNLGVKTGPDDMDVWKGATVDSVAQVLGEFIDLYKAANASKPYAERPKVLIVIDSLGMLVSPTQEKQFSEGDMKGDLGSKAKQLSTLIRVAQGKIGNQPIGIVVTNHVMEAQDKYTPAPIPGGKVLEFAAAAVIQINKLLLREDEDGKKLEDGEVAGIRASVWVRKSRYAKPFRRVQVRIPYDTGMDPYSGLFDLFESKGVIRKEGQRYVYISPETGEVFKDFRKNFRRLGILDQIMKDWPLIDTAPVPVDGFDETGATGNEDDDAE